MRRFAFALFLFLPLAATAQSGRPDVRDVWTRATVGGGTNAAVYMTITAITSDRLIAASTPAATRADLMTIVGGSGAMEMTYLKDIDIPAGKPVNLNPTGMHVWLAGLRRPLKAGESFPLSLTFEKAGRRDITVSVIKPSAAPPTRNMQM